MGRKRRIDRNALIRAIETVARREGMDGLSIDAVAREAGISKSSVLYDVGSKSALLAEFIRCRLDMQTQGCEAALRRHEGRPNPFLRAMIDNFRSAPTDEEISVAMLVCAGVGEHADCRDIMRAKIAEDTRRIIEEATDKRETLRALLALHGLAFLEYFGFYRFDETTRNQLLDDLMAIAEKGEPAGADGS